ncbi:neuromedin-U receptor 2-like, partial [Saccostrea cucullata]|uniref:neuromedin-U receptor 2-like n=1 Tax=Saccostrea cuccullata TaxID=36930 RepID=UPI002ED5C539
NETKINVSNMSNLWNYSVSTTTDNKTFPPLNITSSLLSSTLLDNYRNYNNQILVTQFLPTLVYVCILFVVGIIGNALVCYVYKIKWKIKKKPSTLFILVLAGYDLVNCFVTMPFEIALVSNYISFDFPIVCKLSRFMTYGLNAASTVILLGIAIDRLLGIRYGFKLGSLTMRQARLIVALSLFLGILTNWPALLLYGTYEEIGFKTCYFATQYKNSDYVTAQVVFIIVTSLIGDIIFISIYSLIGYTIYQQQNKTVKSKDTNLETARICCKSENDICNIPDQSRTSIDFTQEKGKSTMSLFSKGDGNGYNSFAKTDLFLQQENKPESRGRSGSEAIGSLLTLLKTNTESQKHRSSTFSNSEGKRFGPSFKARKTTFMLFTVTIVYILTFLPFGVLGIVDLHRQHLSMNNLSVVELNLYHLLFRSYMLSMAVNPIIFSFLNKHFRSECFSLLKDALLCVFSCFYTRENK